MTRLSWIEKGVRASVAGHGRSITVKRVIPGGINTTSGARARAETSFTCSAIRDPARLVAGGAADTEEFRYTVVLTDLGFTPDANDTITDGGAVRQVVSVAATADNLGLVITTRVKK